jgi:hypothetical protein
MINETVRLALNMVRQQKRKPTSVTLDQKSYDDLAVVIFELNPYLKTIMKDINDLTIEDVPVYVDRNRIIGSFFIEIESE